MTIAGIMTNRKARRRSITGVLVTALLWLMPVSYAFAVKMENIEFSSLPGDKVEIRMQFDGTPPDPTGYTIEQPARIALDLMDVKSGLSSKYHALGSGNARSITVVEADDRTRVIVSLTELVAYTASVSGNTLFVRVGDEQMKDMMSSAGAGDNTDFVGTSADVIEEPDVPTIRDIDFRRGENGEGRVIVDLSDPGIGVDVSTESGRIRIAFTNTVVPEKLQRRLDVSDFATPVLIVDTLPEAGDAVMSVQPNSEVPYEYLAYQADNIFTLEVKPLDGSSGGGTTGSAFLYKGEKLSLNFQDIEIRSVLQLIADFTDLNLVASDTVGGRITLRLKNVPWDQALEIIMKTKGLDKRQVGNVLMVAPAAELAAREKLELESRQQISELAPLVTEFIEVKYANARDIFDLFQSAGDEKGVLSPRGSVIVDERTNSIILTETSDRIGEFREVLDKLDVPVRQVLIEARIVNAEENFRESVGISWGQAGGGVFDNRTKLVQYGANLNSVSAVRDAQINGTALDINPLDNLVVNHSVASTTNLALGFVSGDDFLLDLQLQLAESEDQIDTIARPKIITSDKTEAEVSSGFQIPYQEESQGGGTTTQFVAANISLKVTPQITPDGRLILDLDVTNDRPGAAPAGGGAPPISTQSLTTQVLVDDGATIVLGGLLTTQDDVTISKTPFLGDLPIVGQMFRSRAKGQNKNELLIFVTPRLIEETRR